MTTTLIQCMTPPGSGIYTVNKDHNRQAKIEKALYPEQEPQAAWENSLERVQSAKTAIIALPSDNGGGICRGAAWGPSAVRETLYQSLKPELDIGDILVNPHLLMDEYLNPETIKNCQEAMFEGKNYPVSPLSLAEFVINKIYETNPSIKLFALGGDHSCSYPFVKSTLSHYKKQGKRIGLIHFDAHTDLLEERMGVPICFGSWTSHALQYLSDPADCIQIGIRATGKPKAYWEGKLGIKQFYMPDFNEEAILKYITARNLDGVYITFDIDAIDAKHVAATGTPEEGGLHPEQCLSLINQICGQQELIGADLMEVAPFISRDKNMNEPESTLEVATQIAQTCYQHLLA